MKSPKDTAVEFLRKIIAGEIRAAYQAHTTSDFRHHNAYYKGDARSLMEGMEQNHENFPEKIFTIKSVLADGPLVAVHSLMQFHAQHTGIAVVHLFRFDGDKIAELWDVAQVLPDDSPNENGPL